MPLTPHIASSKVPMRGGPRPQHVLYRGNGVYAPLIAFDELPPDIQLQGVSRILTSAQTAGMTFLGEQDHAGFYTSVQGHRLPLRPAVLASSSPAVGAPSSANANNRAPFQAPDARIRQSLQQNGVAMSKNASQESHHSSPGSLPTGNVRSPVAAEASSDRARTGPDSTRSLIDTIASCNPAAAARVGYLPYNQRPLPPSGIEPDGEKKIYCTYWLQHGQCAFEQQGCRYKHEIPDKETLAKIGFPGGLPRTRQDKQPVRLRMDTMPATEAQRRNAAMFAELRARKPGDEDTDSDSDEEVLPTKKPFSKSTVQQPVGKAVNSAAVSPRVESRNSVVAAYVSPDSSSSSENSLIDLETPESSCSSSPTTIIPIIRSNAVTQTSSKGPIVSQSGVLVPTDEKAASRPIPLMANREAPPAPTAESKQAENAVAKDGYIRYFPENERLNELQSPANPRPVSLNVHSDKTSPLRQRFREEDDRLQAQTVRAPALDRANQAQTSNGIEERPVKASLSKPSEADRLANRNARARMITAALPSGLSHIRRSIATTDVAPTPNNTPTSSASGLAASKHATATAPGIVPATSEAHRKRKVKTLTAHAKPSMLTGSVQPRLTLTKKERRDILRQAERDLQRERPQPITTPKPKRVTFENNRAEKAENEVRVLKAKLAMSGMERRNAVSEGSEGGDEASKVKGKGKAAAVDLLSA